MKIPQRLRSFEARAAKNKNEKVEMGECGILLDGKWLKTGDAIEVHSPMTTRLSPWCIAPDQKKYKGHRGRGRRL